MAVSFGVGCLLPDSDCDDADPNNYPGNSEICDGQDNDCVNGIDNGLDTDADGDGVSFGVGCLLPDSDCDDADPNNYPGNSEICDSQDNDCVNGIDNGLDTDADGDGVSFGPGCLLPGNDCDDADPSNYPGNSEICDSQDNDCVNGIDNGLDTDADGDGVSFGVGCLLPGNDCDDADPSNYPGNSEICDGQDNDCVNGSDDGLDTDADGDGVSFGVGCLLPGSDCDDADPNNYPGNSEICDSQDNDCVNGIDNGLDTDADGDGVSFGVGCLLPDSDCDDADPNNYPGQLRDLRRSGQRLRQRDRWAGGPALRRCQSRRRSDS